MVYLRENEGFAIMTIGVEVYFDVTGRNFLNMGWGNKKGPPAGGPFYN